MSLPVAHQPFTNLGVAPFGFQGGFVLLRGHGCPGCGHGFWTEDGKERQLTAGTVVSCPRCAARRAVA